ncbi:MAG TPA: hypothetical protein VHB21_22305, partial [Minicystis sp.]|nr:hypothetical protein [Minicystis sp.]
MRSLPARAGAVALVAALAGCGVEASAPGRAPSDARGGHAPSGFARDIACGTWEAAAHGDSTADAHDSFPELDASSCYVRVRYGERGAKLDATPKGCGYPDARAPGELLASAARYERVAAGDLRDVPKVLGCGLPASVRAAAARANAATMRALAAALAGPR